MADRNPDARVTAEQVSEIISTDLSEERVNAMINLAHLVVQERLVGKNLSEAMLEQIELLLAAHYVCMADPRKKSVKVDEVAVTYESATGAGLQATPFGQQAAALDPTGTLTAASAKRAVIRAE